MKRSTTTGEVPTIPPITAVTLNQFTPTDIFEGEFFLNSADDLLWIRTENGILPISLSGSTGTTVTPTLTQVLYEGNTTNGYDISVSSGDTIIYGGLDTATTNRILGLDNSGNTIVTSVSNISAGKTYFFNTSVDSDIADYKELSEEPTTASTQTTTVSLPGSTNDNFIQQFITPQLGFNIIPAGVQRFYLNFLKPAENDEISAYIELQLTDFSGGTIGSPITSGIESIGWNGTSPYELPIDVVFPTTIISPTNRMSVKVYCNNYASSSHNITFYTEGNEYSFVITTVSQSQGIPVGPRNPYLQQEITIPSGNTNPTISTSLDGTNGNFFLFNITANTSNWTQTNRTLSIEITGATNFVDGAQIYLGINVEHLTTGATSNNYLVVNITDISTLTNLTECAVYARATYSSSISYPINTWGNYLYGLNRGTLSVVRNNTIQ